MSLKGGIMRFVSISNKAQIATERYLDIYTRTREGGDDEPHHALVHPRAPEDAAADAAHGHLRRGKHPSRGRDPEHVAAGGFEAAQGSRGHARCLAVRTAATGHAA